MDGTQPAYALVGAGAGWAAALGIEAVTDVPLAFVAVGALAFLLGCALLVRSRGRTEAI